MSKKTPILIIYTGGTIGMVRDYKSNVLKAFDFDNLKKNIPELNLINCKIDTISFDEPLDSSNIHPDDWIKIVLCSKIYVNRLFLPVLNCLLVICVQMLKKI